MAWRKIVFMSNVRRRPPEGQTVKDVLSRDYHVPGISRRYYSALAVVVTVFILAELLTGHHGLWSGDMVFAYALGFGLVVSVVAAATQRVGRRRRR